MLGAGAKNAASELKPGSVVGVVADREASAGDR